MERFAKKVEQERGLRRGIEYVRRMFGEPIDRTEEEEEDLETLARLEPGIEYAVDKTYANYNPGIEPPELTLLEKIGGWTTRGLVERPFENIEDFEAVVEAMKAFETCQVEERFYDDTPVLWLNFSGIADGTEPRAPQNPARRMCPREGVQVNFEGPTGIAGLSPEQCARCTDMVYEHVKEIVARYPNYQVRVFGYSAGTHLSTYVANQLGIEEKNRVDKFVAVSTGQSIGYGIDSSPVTAMIAQTIENSGLNKYEYTDGIAPYVQKNNVKWLPQGEKSMIIGGDNDRFIPYHAEGGTDDQIEIHKQHNPDLGVYMAHGRDHASIVLHLNKLQRQGEDVFRLGEKPSGILYEEMPPYLQEKLIALQNSSDDPDEPNKHVLDLDAIIRSDQASADSHGQRLALQEVANRNYERTVVDVDGNVALEPQEYGYVLSETILEQPEECAEEMARFLQTHAPRAANSEHRQ